MVRIYRPFSHFYTYKFICMFAFVHTIFQKIQIQISHEILSKNDILTGDMAPQQQNQEDHESGVCKMTSREQGRAPWRHNMAAQIS